MASILLPILKYHTALFPPEKRGVQRDWSFSKTDPTPTTPTNQMISLMSTQLEQARVISCLPRLEFKYH